MFRYLISITFIGAVIAASGYFFFREYWEHRYEELIPRQARGYNIHQRLVWSLTYE